MLDAGEAGGAMPAGLGTPGFHYFSFVRLISAFFFQLKLIAVSRLINFFNE